MPVTRSRSATSCWPARRSALKSTDGLTVAAEIVAQAKGDKVTVFKKRRRHNYRRKQGHRQLHTILKIVAIGDHKEAEKKAAPKAEAKPRPQAPAPASRSRGEGRDAAQGNGRSRGRRSTKSPAKSPASRPRIRRPTTPRRPGAAKPAAKKASSGQSRGQNPVDKKCCTC